MPDFDFLSVESEYAVCSSAYSHAGKNLFFVSSSFTSSYSASTTLSSAFAFSVCSAFSLLRFCSFFIKLHRKLLNDCLKLIFFALMSSISFFSIAAFSASFASFAFSLALRPLCLPDLLMFFRLEHKLVSFVADFDFFFSLRISVSVFFRFFYHAFDLIIRKT